MRIITVAIDGPPVGHNQVGSVVAAVEGDDLVGAMIAGAQKSKRPERMTLARIVWDGPISGQWDREMSLHKLANNKVLARSGARRLSAEELAVARAQSHAECPMVQFDRNLSVALLDWAVSNGMGELASRMRVLLTSRGWLESWDDEGAPSFGDWSADGVGDIP